MSGGPRKARPRAGMPDLKRIDNFLPAQRGLGIVFRKTPMGPASNFHCAARDQDLGAGNRERLGQNENGAKPLKRIA